MWRSAFCKSVQRFHKMGLYVEYRVVGFGLATIVALLVSSAKMRSKIFLERHDRFRELKGFDHRAKTRFLKRVVARSSILILRFRRNPI